MTRYFTYKSLDDLRADTQVQENAHIIDFADDLSPLLQPATIAGRAVGNRMAVHPMEGCDGTLGGEPDELTFRRWEGFGAGGAKLIWGEATAVVPEARANPRQLLLSEASAPAFRRLLDATRKAHLDRFGRDDDLLVGLQLTHSGRWSYPTPLIAARIPAVDSVKGQADLPLLDDSYLDQLIERYAVAAGLARDIGFDFVDIKQCHTYLLNEVLSSRADGKYGGSFGNRTRFIRDVLAAIRSRTPDLILATRLNTFDGPPYAGAPGEIGHALSGGSPWGTAAGGTLASAANDAITLVGLLRESGVSLVNLTMGSPYYNPHIGRPFERSPVDGYVPPEHPLTGVARHFLMAAAVQQAWPDVAMVGTGYSWLRHYAANAGAANIVQGWTTFMGLGRGALAYPDFAADIAEHGRMTDRKSCIGVSYCTTLMRAKHNELGQFATGCAPRDPFYAEQYKLATRPNK